MGDSVYHKWLYFDINLDVGVIHILNTLLKHKEKTMRKLSEGRCWKRKHAGVILDGLDQCTGCGGIFTPVLPSVPRHLLRALIVLRKGLFCRNLD